MENIYQKIEIVIEKEEKSINHYLANFVLEHFEKIPEWTIDEFAKKSNCSKPSVIRFCKSVECSGFAELKFQIRDYLKMRNQKRRKVNFNLSCDSQMEIADFQYLKVAHATFNQLYTFYKSNEIMTNKLTEKLATSRLVYVFGSNFTYNFSKNFCEWLRLLGINVVYCNDLETASNYLTNLMPTDTIICLSLSGKSRWLKTMSQRLKHVPNYKFGVLGSESPFCKVFDDVADLPQFETELWNLTSIRAQALVQFLDYLYFDLAKSNFLQK